MRTLIAMVLCLGVGFAGAALAQDKDARKAPTAAQKKQQERMRDCNEKAGDRKGRERQEFMGTCLKSGSAKKGAKMTEQQQRMATCNKQAGAKGMKGDERKAFMSECLKS